CSRSSLLATDYSLSSLKSLPPRLAFLIEQFTAEILVIMSFDLGGFLDFVLALVLGGAGVGLDPAIDLGLLVDEEPAAVVDDVTGDHAADDDLGVSGEGDIAADAAEDMDAAAFLHVEIAVDQAAGVELAALDDADGAADDTPEGERLVNDHVTGDPAPLFSHGRYLTGCPPGAEAWGAHACRP